MIDLRRSKRLSKSQMPFFPPSMRSKALMKAHNCWSDHSGSVENAHIKLWNPPIAGFKMSRLKSHLLPLSDVHPALYNRSSCKLHLHT